jgi:hypothetical protein
VFSIYIKHFVNSKESSYYSSEKKEVLNGIVKIYNATGVNGLAKEMKLFLKMFDIKVSATQNSNTSAAQTKLYSKPTSKDFAAFVAKLIDYQPELISTSDTIDVDLVIIIGSDYKLLKPFKN